MVWEGQNSMLGEANQADSKPHTIRGDFCLQVGRNAIHGGDSVKSAERGAWVAQLVCGVEPCFWLCTDSRSLLVHMRSLPKYPSLSAPPLLVHMRSLPK